MKQIKQLLEESFQVKSTSKEDNIFESVNEFDTLEEAINQFAELPDAWKKYQMSYQNDNDDMGRSVGQNSKIISKASKMGFKSIDAATRFVKKAIDFDDVAIVWVEVNDTPLVAVFKTTNTNGNKKFNMITDQGGFFNVYQKISYTSGFRNHPGKGRRYHDPEYKYRTSMALSDIEVKINDKLYGLTKAALGKEDGDSVSDDEFKSLKFKIDVKGLGVDETRLSKQADRKANKDFTSGEVQNRINTAIKYIKSKLTITSDQIRINLLKEFDKFERGEKYSFESILNDMKSLDRVMRRLEDIKKNKNFQYKNKWNDSLDWDLERALKYAKEIEDAGK